MDKNNYVGAFSIAASLTDIKFNFMEVNPIISEVGEVISESKETIGLYTVSLPLAKLLAKQLSAIVADYEMRFGEIINIEDFNGSKQEG